jgi:hypothetical protein
MADEASDISRKEWMSLFFRVVDCNGKIQEIFAGVSTLENTTSQTLFQTITDRMKEWKLDLKECIGQSYDGASNMIGHVKGLRTLISEVAESALYIHCCAHNLNLVLVDVAKNRQRQDAIPCVAELFHVLQRLYNFLAGSPKRLDVFRNAQNQNKSENSRNLTLKQLSDTRWSSRYEALKAVNECFKSILDSLKIIKDTSTDAEHRIEAQSLIDSLKDFPFLIAFQCFFKLLGMINALSKSFQSETQDLAQAVNLLEATKGVLLSFRSDEEHFDKLYDQAAAIAEDLDVEPNTPLSGRKTRRRDELQTLLTPKEFYRTQMWAPTVSSFYDELDNALSPSNGFKNFNNKDILEFARLYPKFLDADDLAHELDTFAKLKKLDDFKDCKTLEDVCKEHSPRIHFLKQLLIQIFPK